MVFLYIILFNFFKNNKNNKKNDKMIKYKFDTNKIKK